MFPKLLKSKILRLAIAADEDIRLELLGFTSGSEGSVGQPDKSVTVSSSLDSFGLVFTRNVNYFADNNSPLEVTSLGENSRNADCFTLYEGDQEVGCSVSLLADGGNSTVNYLTIDGEKKSTTERNVIYVKPQTSLKADTQYRLVIDEMLTGNNNVHLDGDLTLYFQTAAQDENTGGGISGGGAGGGTVTEPENPDQENPDEEVPGETENPDEGSADFADVPEGAWYTEAVDYVVSKGLFNGVSESEFSPDGQMSRAMFATVTRKNERREYYGIQFILHRCGSRFMVYRQYRVGVQQRSDERTCEMACLGRIMELRGSRSPFFYTTLKYTKVEMFPSVENNSYAQMKDAADVCFMGRKGYELGI